MSHAGRTTVARESHSTGDGMSSIEKRTRNGRMRYSPATETRPAARS